MPSDLIDTSTQASLQFQLGRDQLVAARKIDTGTEIVLPGTVVPAHVVAIFTDAQLKQLIRTRYVTVLWAMSESEAVEANKSNPALPSSAPQASAPDPDAQPRDPLTCYVCDPPRSFAAAVNLGAHQRSHRPKKAKK